MTKFDTRERESIPRSGVTSTKKDYLKNRIWIDMNSDITILLTFLSSCLCKWKILTKKISHPVILILTFLIQGHLSTAVTSLHYLNIYIINQLRLIYKNWIPNANINKSAIVIRKWANVIFHISAFVKRMYQYFWMFTKSAGSWFQSATVIKKWTSISHI